MSIQHREFLCSRRERIFSNCQCDGRQTFASVGHVFKGHEGVFILLVFFKNSFFNNFANNFWASFGFLLQAENERVSDAARRRSFTVVYVDVGRVSSVSQTRVDQLVEAHNKLNICLYGALQVIDELFTRLIPKCSSRRQDKHQIEPLFDLGELAPEDSAHIHYCQQRTHRGLHT